MCNSLPEINAPQATNAIPFSCHRLPKRIYEGNDILSSDNIDEVGKITRKLLLIPRFVAHPHAVEQALPQLKQLDFCKFIPRAKICPEIVDGLVASRLFCVAVSCVP